MGARDPCAHLALVAPGTGYFAKAAATAASIATCTLSSVYMPLRLALKLTNSCGALATRRMPRASTSRCVAIFRCWDSKVW